MWYFSENKEWMHLEERFDWVKRMKDVVQDPRYHAEGNVDVHTRMVLDALQNDADFRQLAEQEQEILWTAALLHDVEKYSTTVFETDGSITSKGHARKGARFAQQLLYMHRETPFDIRQQIVALVRYHGLPIWLFEKPDPLKALLKVSLEVNTQWLALLARADMHGRTCSDQEEMLYRIACFEEFCRENNCWGHPRQFPSAEAKMHYFSHEEGYPDYLPFDQPTAEVILMSGLPGAGKDTFIRNHYPDRPVVSLDGIRKEWGIAPTDKKGNGRVIQEAKERARTYLRKQQSFIWNATNTTSQMRMQLIELFSTYKAKTSLVYIEVSYKELHGQNKNRDAVVPAAVLDKLAYNLEVPKLWEAHQVTYHLH